MSCKPDISVIIPTANPKFLALTVDAARRQKYTSFSVEFIVVQEADDFAKFSYIHYPSNMRVIQQPRHFDCGSTAKDAGIADAVGEKIVFWDDDNLYYETALSDIYAESRQSDITIMKVRHFGRVIPIEPAIIPGEIDTMCLCASRVLASSTPWADGYGRYSDYRWVARLAQQTTNIHYSTKIIGEHL